MASLIAHAFHIDPLTVLDSTYWEWSVREAAFHALQKQIEKQRPKKG